jgi:hypothetical protein
MLEEEGPVFVCLKIDLGDQMTQWDAVRVDVLEESRAVQKALAGTA